MKPKFRSLIAAFAPLQRSSIILVASFAAASSAYGASQTWSATPTDANWTTATNWVAGAVPGATYVTGNTVNNDIVTFSSAITTYGGSVNPVQVDLNRHIGSITYNTASAGAYVIGGNPLKVSHTGAVQLNADVLSAQTINAAIEFRLPSSTAGVYTFRNNATASGATLTFNGTVTSQAASTRPVALTLEGTNTGLNEITNILGHGPGQRIDLIKSGAGNWILSAANDFGVNTSATNAGSVTINAGTLVVKNGSALSTNSVANGIGVFINAGTLEITNGVTMDNGLSLNLFNGATVLSNGTNATNGRINLGASAGIAATLSAVGASDVFTIGNGTNDLSGGATDTVINISGLGTIFQSAASNYIGGWSVNSGTLRLGSPTALGITSIPVAFGASSTGLLQLNGNSVTIGSLATNPVAGSPVIENGVLGSATLTVGGSAVTTYAGLIRNGAAGTLALTKSGVGTLDLSAGNTYSGGTTISGGLLKVNNLTGTSATGTNAVTVASGGTLGGSGFISGAVTVNNAGSISPGNSVGALTVGSLTLDAGSKLNFEFNSTPAHDFVNVTAAAGLTINGGGFNLYQEGTLDAFSTNGTTYNLIGHSGAINGTGIGSLSVLNPQPGKSYTFSDTGTMVNLAIAASGVVSNWSADASGSWSSGGSWTGAVPNGIGQTANFNFPLTAVRTVSLDGGRTLGGISFNGGASPVGYVIAPGSGGSLSINNGLSQASIIVTSGANLISADVLLDSSNTVAAVAAGASLTISGSIGGIGSLVKSGPGLLDLTNPINSYGGNTTISGGTLGFAGLGSLGAGNLTFDAGTLFYNTGNTADISGKLVTFATGGGVINTNGNNVTLLNAIGNAGGGSFTKSGAGVLTMNGNNDFTGSTTITGGSLVLTGSSATTGGTTLNGLNTLLAINSDAALGEVPGAPLANLTLNPGTGHSATFRSDGTFALNVNRTVSVPSGTAVIDTNGNFLTIPGLISGPALIHKISAGGLTLNGVNNVSATGGIMIDAGTVFTNSQANLPGGTITLNGTGGISSGSPAANYNNVVVNGTNSIVKTGTNNILGLGNVTGNGSLTFGGTFVNDFTGNMTGFTGTLILTTGGSRWNGSTGGSNVTLDLTGTGSFVRSSAAVVTIGALAGTPTAVLSGSGGGATQAVNYTIGGKTVDGLGVTPVNSTFPGAITNGANLTSLTKVGLSTLTLSGASSYTGNTSVQEGALILADDAKLAFRLGASGVNNVISGNGIATLTLAGDFNVDLTNPASAVDGSRWTLVSLGTFPANPFAASFSVTGFTEAADVWTLAAGGKTWVFTEATGELTLTLAGYAGWAATNAGGQDASADFDMDGVSNGVEFFMNSAPGFTSNPGLDATNTITWINGGNLTPAEYGTKFVVQTSNDLSVWQNVPVGGLTTNTAGSLSYTLTGPAPHFVRLQVTPN